MSLSPRERGREAKITRLGELSPRNPFEKRISGLSRGSSNLSSGSPRHHSEYNLDDTQVGVFPSTIFVDWPGPPNTELTWYFIVEWKASSAAEGSKKEITSKPVSGQGSGDRGSLSMMIPIEFPGESYAIRITGRSSSSGDASHRPYEVTKSIVVPTSATPRFPLSDFSPFLPSLFVAAMSPSDAVNSMRCFGTASSVTVSCQPPVVCPGPDITHANVEFSALQIANSQPNGGTQLPSITAAIPTSEGSATDLEKSIFSLVGTKADIPEGGTVLFCGLDSRNATASGAAAEGATCAFSALDEAQQVLHAEGGGQLARGVLFGPSAACSERIASVGCQTTQNVLQVFSALEQAGPTHLSPVARIRPARSRSPLPRTLSGIFSRNTSPDTSRTNGFHYEAVVDPETGWVKGSVSEVPMPSVPSQTALSTLVASSRPHTRLLDAASYCSPKIEQASVRVMNHSVVLVSLNGRNLLLVEDVRLHFLGLGVSEAHRPEEDVQLHVTSQSMSHIEAMTSIMNVIQHMQVLLDYVHFSVNSPAGIDIYYYGAVEMADFPNCVRFRRNADANTAPQPPGIVAIGENPLARATVEQLLNKSALLQPVVATLSGRLLMPGTLTKLLMQLESTASTVANTVAQYQSSSFFSRFTRSSAHLKPPSAGDSETFQISNIPHPATSTSSEIVSHNIQTFFLSRATSNRKTPQSLLDSLGLPFKHLFEHLPFLRETSYRKRLVQLISLFVVQAPPGEERATQEWNTDAPAVVVEGVLYAHILNYLQDHCHLPHVSFSGSIHAFCDFELFYHHIARFLLARKYRETKLIDKAAAEFFNDASALWIVCIVRCIRAEISESHFVCVWGISGSGCTTACKTLMEKRDRRGTAVLPRIYINEVPDLATTMSTMQAGVYGTVVIVCEEDDLKTSEPLLKVIDTVVGCCGARATHRIVIAVNKLDETIQRCDQLDKIKSREDLTATLQGRARSKLESRMNGRRVDPSVYIEVVSLAWSGENTAMITERAGELFASSSAVVEYFQSRKEGFLGSVFQ